MQRPKLSGATSPNATKFATQTAEVVAISGDLVASLCAAVSAVGVRGQSRVCSARERARGAGQIGGGRGKVHKRMSLQHAGVYSTRTAKQQFLYIFQRPFRTYWHS